MVIKVIESGPCSFEFALNGVMVNAHHNKESGTAIARLMTTVAKLAKAKLVTKVDLSELNGRDRTQAELVLQASMMRG